MVILILPALLLPMIGGLILRATPALVSAVLRALGVSLLSYAGMSFAIDGAKNVIMANIGQMPALALTVLGMMKFDIAVNIIFAAVVGRIALSTFAGGMKKMTIKK